MRVEYRKPWNVFQFPFDVPHLAVVKLHPLPHGIRVFQGGQGCPHRYRPDVPGKKHGGDLQNDVLIAERISEPQAGQPISLGERTGDDDVLVLPGQFHVGPLHPGKLDVGFVNDEGDSGLGDPDEVLFVHKVTSWIVRVSDHDDFSFRRYGIDYRVGVEQKLPVFFVVDHRHGHEFAAQSSTPQFVDAKARCVLDHLLTRLKETAEDHVVNLARPIADQNILRAVQPVDLGNLRAHDQPLVWIPVRHLRVFVDGLEDFLGRLPGVLVRHHPVQIRLPPRQFNVRGDIHFLPAEPWDEVVSHLFHSCTSLTL